MPTKDGLWYKDAVIYQVHVRAFYDSTGDSVHPKYGNLEDFKAFLDAAHQRGIRVIIEMVLNHTSDQHPWFQESRSSLENPRRDWYVWSDTDTKYNGTRIIFLDTELSNWAWDPVSKQYYWHRFFSHQPDLNYDNPKVREEMWDVMRFWLEMGVDAFRLDAVPYLVEREGTNCENLPETHAVLKDLRSRLDKEFPGRMLLAEANQWPADLRSYFGTGDEFHMAFHFPLMPRMFMGVKLEDRKPITEILKQTPEIPETCQWCLFLRNHDELTLEMVTDMERDYMYDEYARDKAMRLNLGIRRRLAPLLDNDRERIELMNGMLMSLPGTPILYYGDEIGMGDNVNLGDRNGVRTPMQWDGGWNGGFSVRKSCAAFGRGTIEFLYPANHRVLAYVRKLGNETILVVNNLSNAAQAVELDLKAYRGNILMEMFGRNIFPRIGDLPYLLTMGPYQFYWFRLRNV